MGVTASEAQALDAQEAPKAREPSMRGGQGSRRLCETVLEYGVYCWA